MGIFMDALPEEAREKMEKQINPKPENCDHSQNQYVTDGQRFCNRCDSEIERDGNGGFRLYTDGRHDEAYPEVTE